MLGTSLASILMQRRWQQQSLITGLAVYALGTFSLYFVPTDSLSPTSETKEVNGPQRAWANIFLVLTSITFSPLSLCNGLFALEYVTKRYPGTETWNVVWVQAASAALILLPPLFQYRLRPVLGRDADIKLAVFCLCVAIAACIILANSPSLLWFAFGMVGAKIGTAYIFFIKSIIASSDTSNRLHFRLFAHQEAVEAVGHTVAGFMLKTIYQLELEWDRPGLVYLGILVACVIGLLCLILFWLWKKPINDEMTSPGVLREDIEHHGETLPA
jgi:hypothetical protein